MIDAADKAAAAGQHAEAARLLARPRRRLRETPGF